MRLQTEQRDEDKRVALTAQEEETKRIKKCIATIGVEKDKSFQERNVETKKLILQQNNIEEQIDRQRICYEKQLKVSKH